MKVMKAKRSCGNQIRKTAWDGDVDCGLAPNIFENIKVTSLDDGVCR